MKSKLKTVIRLAVVMLLLGTTIAGLVIISAKSGRNNEIAALENPGINGMGSDENSDIAEVWPASIDGNLISDDVAGGALLFRSQKENLEQGADSYAPSAVYTVNVGSSLKTAAESRVSTLSVPLSTYFENRAIVNEDLVKEYLNVRFEPNESSEILAIAELGMILDVIKEADGWTYIRFGEVSGWVKTEYIWTGAAAAAYVEAHADPYAEVTVPNMNIRLGKSTSSGILDIAYQGDAFPLVGIEDGWVRVKLGDVLYGYLAGNCVTINYDWNGYVIATQVAGALEEEVKDMTPPERPANVHWEAPSSPSVPSPSAQQEQDTSNQPTVPQENTVPSSEPTPQAPSAEEPSVTPSADPIPETPSVDPEQETPSQGGSTEEVVPPEQPSDAPSQEAPTPDDSQNVPERTIVGIEAFYTGSSQKVEGDVMTRAEVCVYVYFSDGSTEIITEGWTSDRIGMILHAGEEVITISYAGFTSNIVLQVAAAPVDPQPSDPTPTDPQPSEPAPTDPQPSEPAPTDPQPSDPTPTDPQPSEPTPTDPQPSDPTPTDSQPSDPQPTDPLPSEPTPSQPSEDEAYVNNVPLSGELTAYALRICSQYGVDSSVIFSVMYQESGFNPNATSGSGAIGLMQIIQRYSQDRMNRLGVTDLYDPKSNMLVGIDMLAEYYYTYGGWVPALTRYRYGTPSGSSDYANLILSRASMFQ